MIPMTTRNSVHSLVDELPDESLEAAARALAGLRDDPVLRALLSAPEDDELFDDEDGRALRESQESVSRMGTIGDAELARRLGI